MAKGFAQTLVCVEEELTHKPHLTYLTPTSLWREGSFESGNPMTLGGGRGSQDGKPINVRPEVNGFLSFFRHISFL